MTDETEQNENEQAEAVDEIQGEDQAQPAEAVADEVQEAEEAPADEASAEEPVAEAATTDEEAPTEEPVAEAAVEAEAEAEAEAAPADDEAPAAESEAAAVTTAKPKKKRLPRSQRPPRSKPKREKPAERKSITRLPKPEHVRGRSQERQGKVVSAAMDKTIVVRVDTVKVHPRYKKVIRRSSKFHAHDEQNEAKVGDTVLIVETRPLSRMKRWRLQRVVEAAK